MDYYVSIPISRFNLLFWIVGVILFSLRLPIIQLNFIYTVYQSFMNFIILSSNTENIIKREKF